MMKRLFFLPLFLAAIIAFTLVHPVSAQAETVYVFVNSNVPDSALTQTEIQNIYLGKKDKWNDNQKINFTALNGGACHEAFLKQDVGRTDFQFQNYWKKQIFTGQGQPPRSFGSDAELVDYVSRTTGAIGYSCTQPDTGKVKILTIN
jgi:ABC-type phosphate transport system substrate-binding protein